MLHLLTVDLVCHFFIQLAIQRAKEKTETIKEKAEKEREAEEAEIRSQEQIEEVH